MRQIPSTKFNGLNSAKALMTKIVHERSEGFETKFCPKGKFGISN